jgi:hypothetical protein
MVEILDDLIEQVEVLSNEITKINFDIDGFKEESDRLIEKRPFMVRQIQQNEKKMIKLLKNLEYKMKTKADLDVKLNTAQAEYRKKNESKDEKSKDENIKKTKTK